MGADLYIRSIDDSKGYFRDPYNPSSILWTLGMSWWEMRAKGEKAESGLIDENRLMSPENAKILLSLVKAQKVVITKELFEEWSDDKPEEVEAFFKKKINRLIGTARRGGRLKCHMRKGWPHKIKKIYR